ncbi:hypothetical protein ABFT80_14005 [Mesorhizobium sp. SB112]|uniref:hypothetical protein n=1 Tax=Mesorhizobium sp. SB112 TaxID=3151853 RepID=UPI00326639E7
MRPVQTKAIRILRHYRLQFFEEVKSIRSYKSSLIAAYFDKIEKADVQKKYQVDIYVGDPKNAPPANETRFVLAKDGFWTVADWSRGALEDSSSFLKLNDALDYSYNTLANTPDFRKTAGDVGYKPPRYEFAELVYALSIAFCYSGVRFSVRKSSNEITAAKEDLLLKQNYSQQSKSASGTIHQLDKMNCKFENLSNALLFYIGDFSKIRK